jgi:Leucine-rich repeat (LRR) protein
MSFISRSNRSNDADAAGAAFIEALRRHHEEEEGSQSQQPSPATVVEDAKDEIEVASNFDAEQDQSNDNNNELEEDTVINIHSKKRWIWCFFSTLTLVAVVVGITVGILVGNNNNNNNNRKSTAIQAEEAPSFATLEEYYEHIYEILRLTPSNVTNMRHWTDPEQPQYKALQFLIYQDTTVDPSLFRVNAINVQQRLGLLVLYFATGGPTSWALDDWIVPGVDECDWQFVECAPLDNTTVVVDLELQLVRMAYALPKEPFAWLPHLQRLDVSQNRLQGSVPWTLWTLNRLRHLNLGKNDFKGRLPTDLQHLSDMQYFGVDGNLFTGPLPNYMPGQGNLASRGVTKGTAPLESFNAEMNQFTGSIADTWWPYNSSRIPVDCAMTSLNLRYNSLTGSLPSQIGLWTNLKILATTLNGRMNGTIPTEFGKLSKLERLSLGHNSFSGSFPFEYVLPLPNLEWMTLSTNNFYGTIPAQALIRDYPWKMISWSMHSNAFSGELPSELGFVSSLQLVQFSFNQFHGELPTCHMEYGWPRVEILWVHKNPGLFGEMPCRRADQQANSTDTTILDFRSDCSSNSNMECSCCMECF